MPRAARRLKSSPKPTGFSEDALPFTHDDVVQGVPAKRVQDLIDRGVLGEKTVYRVIPERTFKRRLANREALKTSEGDIIARFMRLTGMAIKMFGDRAFAVEWMSLPNPALGNRIPLELAETDAGAREVEDVIGRIAHGVYS